MDSDFHYYGTGTAAIVAGFPKREARQIAFAAQFVDWFDSEYWSNWRIVDSRGQSVKDSDNGLDYVYHNPQLSIQTIGWKLAVDYDQDIWTPFHFPPGNLEYELSEDDTAGWQRTFCRKHKVRETNLLKRDQNKLCRPYSKFAMDLIVDTCAQYKNLTSLSGLELANHLKGALGNRIRCPVSNGKKMAMFLLGLRMHVLADTWAHQDFTGEQNKDINFAGFDNLVVAKDQQGKFQKTIWTGVRTSDCSNVRPVEVDLTCGGHGQLGMYPDYSWLTFKYPASWMATGGKKLHLRNNPKEYSEAWRWLSFAMGLCLGSNDSKSRPDSIPKEIEQVISTWRKLSTREQIAIHKSETNWKKTSLAKDFAEDLWKYTKQKNPSHRGECVWKKLDRSRLGLRQGLAITRGGTIDIKQNSILHYMELAATMHYQFCVDWIKSNPGYSWNPAPAET